MSIHANVRASHDPLLHVATPAGLQRLSLANCGWDAIAWPELEQLQQLRNLTLP